MGFKVVLNLDEDDELRAYLKNMIDGTVKSITRKELKAMIYGMAEEKTSTGMTAKVEAEIRSIIREHLSRISLQTTILSIARDEIRDMVKKQVKLPEAISFELTPKISGGR